MLENLFDIVRSILRLVIFLNFQSFPNLRISNRSDLPSIPINYFSGKRYKNPYILRNSFSASFTGFKFLAIFTLFFL